MQKNLDKIERGFVFRVTRGVPLTLALIAGGLVVATVLVALFTLLPPKQPTDPTPATEPGPVALTAQDVASAVAAQQSAAKIASTAAREASAPANPPVSEGAREVAMAVYKIRELMPSAQYAWADEYRTVCAQRYYGYCLEERRELSRRGVSGRLVGVMDLYDEPGSSSEKVRLRELSTEYTVNGSNAGEKVRALEAAVAVLQPIAVAERGAYLAAWSDLWQEREQTRIATIQAERNRVARERADEEARFAREQEEKRSLRMMATMGFGYAMLAIWLFGLTLALLAIERNTRARAVPVFQVPRSADEPVTARVE
jgi:hypothetical protein